MRSARLTCHEGSVRWYNPVGALRLEVSPIATKGFRLCFIIESGNAAVKLSHERDEPVNVKPPTNRKQYLRNLETIVKGSGTSKEICMSSSEPVILYMETEITGRLGYQTVFLQYDVIQQRETYIDGNVYNTNIHVVFLKKSDIIIMYCIVHSNCRVARGLVRSKKQCSLFKVFEKLQLFG